MPTEITLDGCLKCSDCNAVCPVLSVEPAYPGPKHLGPELERLRRVGLPCDSDWIEHCLGCHRCDLACPNQVEVSGLIAAAKARHAKPPIRRLRDFWLARPGLLGRLLSTAPGLANFALGLGGVRKVMAHLLRITPERRFPAYLEASIPSSERSSEASPVLFFPGCAIRYNQPDLGRAVVALLERSGLAVSVSEAGCCGLPAQANGDRREAASRARAAVEALAATASAGTPIVTACTSCGQFLKSGLAELLEDDPEMAGKARMIARQTYDLGELLIERSDRRASNPAFRQQPLRLAYHAPCHQLAQGIGRPWYHLLRQIPGIEVEDMDAGCCGMSGTFGFKQEKYGASMAAGARLFEALRAQAPQFAVSECATCRMQIEHATGIRAVHPAAVLLAASDRQDPKQA